MSFWTEADDRHQMIAETYYKNIERTHPNSVTTDRLTAPFESYCTWAATSVNYTEYRGPDVKHMDLE